MDFRTPSRIRYGVAQGTAVDGPNGTVQEFDDDAYGNLSGISMQNLATTLLYSGEVTDLVAGQQHLRARYYDPALGRFNSLDPFLGSNDDPQSLHKYAYVHGDPIQGVDPSGTEFSVAGTISVSGLQGNLRATSNVSSTATHANTGRVIAGLTQRSLAQVLNALRQTPHIARQFQRQISKHIIGRHTPPGELGKSIFRTSNPRTIMELIDKTMKTGEVSGNTLGRAGFIFTRTFTSPVGTDPSGQLVYTVKVVVNEVGKLITAFPI